MNYWDNAATTFPKPPEVVSAVREALLRYGANPGRGGHRRSLATADRVYRCREEAAAYFGLDDASRVVFTANCTASLNMVIKGFLSRGGHAVISCWEHNAVMRPLQTLAERAGVTWTAVPAAYGEAAETVAQRFEAAIRPDTRLVLCTHASNVFGCRLPIREIGAMAHRHHLPFAVDAAQTAGVVPIHMERDHIDFLCMPGHKGLYGPMGTGLLLCAGEAPPDTVWEGGTGSNSAQLAQPRELPDRLECGTLNVPGICGLEAAIHRLRIQPPPGQREMRLVQRLYDGLYGVPGIQFYQPRPQTEFCVPLLSLNIASLSSEAVAEKLDEAGIAVRAGLHCAPSAHRRCGTFPDGTVRLCPSQFTTESEGEYVVKILREIARKALHSSQSMVK